MISNIKFKNHLSLTDLLNGTLWGSFYNLTIIINKQHPFIPTQTVFKTKYLFIFNIHSTKHEYNDHLLHFIYQTCHTNKLKTLKCSLQDTQLFRVCINLRIKLSFILVSIMNSYIECTQKHSYIFPLFLKQIVQYY